MASPSATTPAADSSQPHAVSPADIAVGVVIGRTSEFFDFFVFAIASVIVFPEVFFPFASKLDATIYSFVIFSFAFIARPIGTLIFTRMDRAYGKNTKLIFALLLLGSSTVSMGLLPSYETAGKWSIILLAILRIGQGLALGGAWDGLASLLATNAPAGRRGFYAMVPQLGAPLGMIVASLLFAYLAMALPELDFAEWGWRYPFFVAFAINVVALFARLRIVATPEYQHLFTSRDLRPSPVGETITAEGRAILAGAFVPLASFALFHMVSVFPLSWVTLFTKESFIGFLYIEAIGAIFGFVAIVASGFLADRFGRQPLLYWGAIVIAAFSIMAPVLLYAGKIGETIYMIYGFLFLGLSFGQCSGATAERFAPDHRYTASALVSDLAWLFGAGFAPLAALLLTEWFGLLASGLYLLSGAVVTILALHFARRLN